MPQLEIPAHPRRPVRPMASGHPAVRAAARRAEMDAETYVVLKELESSWPLAAQGRCVRD